MSAEKILYSWSFDDKKERSPFWYIIAISVVIGFAIWGFLTKQYGMSFVILLVAGVAFFVENNSEDTIQVIVRELGIKVGDKFYDYSRINSYTLIYSWENAIFLRLNLKQRWVRMIDIKVNNTIAADVKQVLVNFIEENPKQDMSFLDRIIYLLKL